MFNPLIHNANQSYQLLANQMGRITNLFDTPQAYAQPNPQIVQARPIGIPHNGLPLLIKGNNNKMVFNLLNLMCLGVEKNI